MELRNNPTIPGNELQAISTLLAAIRKGEQEQRKSLEYVKKYVTASYACLKSLMDALAAYGTRKDEETKPVSWQDKILNRVTSYLQPKFFSSFGRSNHLPCIAGVEHPFCGTYAETTGQRYKYRYLLMKGKAEGKRH